MIGLAPPSILAAEEDLFQDTFNLTPFFGTDNFNTAHGDSASVRLSASRGLKQASFFYSLNGGSFTSLPLANDTNDGIDFVQLGYSLATRAPEAELLPEAAAHGVAVIANRRAFRVGQEPLDLFRRYCAVYARDQAYCHFSPALIANLERNWNARNRKI